MTVIDRQDGVKFVTQVYRETLPQQSRRLLLETVRQLAKQHGQHLCVYAQGKVIEAAFSNESGYLLGECIWDYFGRPDYMIYCEAVGERATCLLVVIQQGRVYLDMLLLSGDVLAELQPIFSDKQPYTVYTYGDVPIREKETFGGATFTLPKEMVGQFKQLSEPLFPALIPVSVFELKSPDHLRLASLTHRQDKWLAVGLLIIISMLGFLWFWTPQKSNILPVNSVLKTSVQQAWQEKLHQPAPAAIIQSLVSHIDTLYLIPGWQTVGMHYADQVFQATLKASDGGDLWALTDWTKQHFYTMHMDHEQAVLQSTARLAARQFVPPILPMTDVMNTFVHRFSRLLAADAIHVGSVRQDGELQATSIKLTIHALSPDLLALVGEEFKNLPLTLSSADLSIEDGLINGTIQLSLWGR